MIVISLLIFSVFIVLSIYIQSIVAQNMEEEVGQRALAVSKTIAQSPLIIDAFNDANPETIIQPFTKSIEEDIGAEFIVVGNENEIRYSHTLEDRIGKRMVGEDNERALKEGKAYVSKKEGSLGLSIRGKAPIINNGSVIGVVSVGFLLTDVKEMARERNQPIIILFLTFLVIGIIGSVFIAKHLRKLLFHMEPNEIAESLLQKEAILQSTKEGIIAVDRHNQITLLNDSAREILHMEQLPNHAFINQPLNKFVDIPLLKYANEQLYIEDREYILNNEVVLLNIFSLKENDQEYGAVATFRRKTELEKVTKELSMVKQYADGLRSQAHEYSNKIHTILGLLQLGHQEEAIDFIKKDHQIQTHDHQVIMDQIQDPVVQGLLIAKYNQANEKGISLEVDEESQLRKLPSLQHRDVILKVLGNLIDNAYVAVEENPLVTVFITDIGNDIIIEIDDNGPGIKPEDEALIFKHGYSTKSKQDHGTGLFLVKQAITSLKGDIFLEASELQGARFVIIIPKES